MRPCRRRRCTPTARRRRKRGQSMKQLITAIALSVAVAGVFAADAAASKPMTAQQQKMADCSAANKGKKGDEYKAAQKACLSGAPAASAAASAPMTQKEKM